MYQPALQTVNQAVIMTKLLTLHQPGGASPPLRTGTILLPLSIEVYQVASVRLVLRRFRRWWTKLSTNCFTRSLGTLIMYCSNCCQTNAVNWENDLRRLTQRTSRLSDCKQKKQVFVYRLVNKVDQKQHVLHLHDVQKLTYLTKNYTCSSQGSSFRNFHNL